MFLQALPLYVSLFSPEFKMMLTTDAFGSDSSPDAIIIFEQFALVLGLFNSWDYLPHIWLSIFQ